MRHRKSGVKLNRTTSHRQAMFRNMVTSLLKHDRIKTTEAKAKELRRWADQIISLAKRGDLHARRQALSIVREKDVVHKIFEEASERFGAINGGYTRIVKIGRRSGDAAVMTIVELISADSAKPAASKKTKPAVAETKPLETPQAPASASDDAVDTPDAPSAEAAPVAADAVTAEADVADEASTASPETEDERAETPPKADS